MALEKLLQEIAITSFFLFLGVVWLYGTRQRWRLLDPPESWWWFDSQAVVKKLFGSRVAIGLSYLTAVGFIVVGAIGMSCGLMTLCQRMGYCG